MACKSCKKNKDHLKGFDGGISALQEKINQRKKEIQYINENIDPSEFRVKLVERIILISFGWVPLGVGYFHIVKWLISIF